MGSEDYEMKRNSTLGCLTAALVVIVVGILFIMYSFSLGKLYATHTFNSPPRPTVEIRYRGFLDSYNYAFLDRPLFKKQVLWLPSISSPYRERTNATPRIGKGHVQMAMSHWKPYGVHWSADGHRLAVSHEGWYVGAYDLKSKEKIEYNGMIYKIEEVDERIDEFMGAE